MQAAERVNGCTTSTCLQLKMRVKCEQLFLWLVYGFFIVEHKCNLNATWSFMKIWGGPTNKHDVVQKKVKLDSSFFSLGGKMSIMLC